MKKMEDIASAEAPRGLQVSLATVFKAKSKVFKMLQDEIDKWA